MKKHLRILLALIGLSILCLFAVFIINQTAQVYELASAVNPVLGKVVLWMLIGVYVILGALPVLMILRLPKALSPPDDFDSPQFDRYLSRLIKRLRKNVRLRDHDLVDRKDVEAALKILDAEAVAVIRKNAALVFVTTAISQSGRLDAFTVLITQFRMVWQVARTYYQRPSLRDMIHLYSNVAATTFVAGELNDINIAEQVEPIVTGVLGGSLTGSIPGVTVVANLVTNSLFTGSANAYLTLRVGAIAKQYCGTLVKKERRMIRKSASLEAARMLTAIVMSSAGSISRAMVNAAVKSPAKLSKTVIKSSWKKISGRKSTEELS